MTSSSISSYVVVFLLSGLINGPSFTMISFLVLELWQFFFIRDWPEIRKSEIPMSEFCPIPGEWCKLPYAAKCQVYSFYRFWVIKGKPTGGGIKKLPPPTRLGLTYVKLQKQPCGDVLEKKTFLKFLQKSQEQTCIGVSL